MLLHRRHLWVVLSLLAAPAGTLPAWGAEKDTPSREKEEAAKKKEEGLPLKPTRKVEFTTDEATWLSLDVSPDGRTILFELLGHLYALPIEGGEAKRITSGMPFDSQPRYSPDGKTIAFVSDRDGADNVWIARPAGSDPKQLSKDAHSQFASPAWTPDGQYVIVSRKT